MQRSVALIIGHVEISSQLCQKRGPALSLCTTTMENDVIWNRLSGDLLVDAYYPPCRKKHGHRAKDKREVRHGEGGSC